MKNRHHYFKILGIVFGCSVFGLVLVSHFYLKAMLPETIYITAQEKEEFHFKSPFWGKFDCDSSEVVLGQKSNIPAKQVSIVKNDTVTIYSETIGSYDLSFRLFGLWNYKNIALQVVEEQKVIPGGMPVGIYLESEGILVVGIATIELKNGKEVCPCKNILQSGDYIVKAQGQDVMTKEHLMDIVTKSNGQAIELVVRRKEQFLTLSVVPAKTENEQYKLGAWVRDDTQGIGTVTYVMENGQFGALGHGISDADTGLIVDCREGILYQAQIRGIVKGSAGKPGSLSGIICYGEEGKIGRIFENTNQGIFGVANEQFIEQMNREPIEIAYRQDVQVGPATIWCTVDGIMKEYDIRIVEVNTFSGNKNKGMVIEVIDEELLEKTGGIVQGMSGSPIIQDGKLVGAVTHVLVNDPTRGYGIFIENMLEAAG